MIWYEDLYVGYNLLDKKRKVIRKIENRKPMVDTYVITLPRNDYDTLEECLEKTGNVNVKKYIMEQMN